MYIFYPYISAYAPLSKRTLCLVNAIMSVLIKIQSFTMLNIVVYIKINKPIE